jgi:hypothetical protein
VKCTVPHAFSFHNEPIFCPPWQEIQSLQEAGRDFQVLIIWSVAYQASRPLIEPFDVGHNIITKLDRPLGCFQDVDMGASESP